MHAVLRPVGSTLPVCSWNPFPVSWLACGGCCSLVVRVRFGLICAVSEHRCRWGSLHQFEERCPLSLSTLVLPVRRFLALLRVLLPADPRNGEHSAHAVRRAVARGSLAHRQPHAGHQVGGHEQGWGGCIVAAHTWRLRAAWHATGPRSTPWHDAARLLCTLIALLTAGRAFTRSCPCPCPCARAWCATYLRQSLLFVAMLKLVKHCCGVLCQPHADVMDAMGFTVVAAPAPVAVPVFVPAPVPAPVPGIEPRSLHRVRRWHVTSVRWFLCV